jgi:hypothetical protein
MPGDVLEIARYFHGLRYKSDVNSTYVLCLLSRAVGRECQCLDAPFDWELFLKARMRKITLRTTLPTGNEYMKSFPVLAQDAIRELIEEEIFTACSVA